jgi:hypothetical protein
MLDVVLKEHEQALLEEIDSQEPQIAEAMCAALGREFERAFTRFGRWIAEPIEAERRAIEAEQAKLLELRQLRQGLVHHDQLLERLTEQAASVSVGLCR